MKKAETIAKYGEAAWQKVLEQGRARYKAHPEEKKAYNTKYYEEHKEEVKADHKKYNEEHPEEVKANSQEQNRKGGRRYAKHLLDSRTGLQGERNKIRHKHARDYKPYKDIIAPESQLHHEWIPKTAEYRGVALVEADQHMHGFVDVIEILDGEITLLTEEQVRNGGEKDGRGDLC